MTTANQIEAGAEVDRAVAEAIGLGVAVSGSGLVLITSREWDEIRGIDHTTCEGNVACFPFQPSTDLNAAFAAAERVGLFDSSQYGLLLSFLAGNGWVLMEASAILELARQRATGESHIFTIPTQTPIAPTPALAICAAILKLKDA